MPVAEQADGHAARAEEALELGLRRILPEAGDHLGLVEAQDLRRDLPHEHGVGAAGQGRRRGVGGGGRLLARLVPAESERGVEALLAFDDVEGELLRQGLAGVEAVGGEVEDSGEEGGEVADDRGAVRAFVQASVETGEEGEVGLARVLLGALGVDEHGEGHDEALGRLDHAEPLVVEAFVGVAHPAPLQARRRPEVHQPHRREALEAHVVESLQIRGLVADTRPRCGRGVSSCPRARSRPARAAPSSPRRRRGRAGR